MADYDIGEAFRAIEHELIASMTRNLTDHKIEELTEGYEWAQWQIMQLEALEAYKKRNASKFPKQFSEINDRIEQEIKTSYKGAQTAQEREILKRIHNGTPVSNSPYKGIQGEFFKVNDRKMNALTDAVTDDMKTAETAVLRMTNDKYRQIIFNAQVYANSGAGTYAKAVDMATKDFLSAGINCIEYKNGRRVPIDAYAEMALRTANKRAYLQGEGDMRKKWGIHTVILNKRTNACPKCAPFCGKIIVDDVWSGGTAEEASNLGYLLMSDCIAHGLYHPNCQDSHTTYFGDFLSEDDNSEEAELPENEVQANTDSAETLLQQFTPEEREQNIELYNAEQRLNHCERQVQRFERLEEFSLDEGNKQSYGARLSEWGKRLSEAEKSVRELKKTVAIAAGSGIIESRKFSPLAPEKVVLVLRNDSEKWINNLTAEEIRAIRKYTKNSDDTKNDKFYARLNAMLRGEIPGSSTLIYYSNVISNAILRYDLKHDIICYRTLSFDAYKDFSVGDIFKDPQFISTSVVMSRTLKNDFMVIIKVPKGSCGAYIENISKFPNQREFILDKQSAFKVISKSESLIELEMLI